MESWKLPAIDVVRGEPAHANPHGSRMGKRKPNALDFFLITPQCSLQMAEGRGKLIEL